MAQCRRGRGGGRADIKGVMWNVECGMLRDYCRQRIELWNGTLTYSVIFQKKMKMIYPGGSENTCPLIFGVAKLI